MAPYLTSCSASATISPSNKTLNKAVPRNPRAAARIERRVVPPSSVTPRCAMPPAAFVSALAPGSRRRGLSSAFRGRPLAARHVAAPPGGLDVSAGARAPRRAAPAMRLGRRPLRTAAAALAAAVAVSAAAPAPAHALFGLGGRGRKQEAPAITMTNQVPNFSLPSQEATVGDDGAGARMKGVLGGTATLVVKRVAPAVGTVALAVWAVGKVLRRAQEKQLRDFQSQLKSFSSMLDLDTAGISEADLQEGESAAEKAKQILGNSQRYKFRTAEQETEAEAIAAQVRLDLFQNNDGESAPASPPAAFGPGGGAAAPTDPAPASGAAVSDGAGAAPAAPTGSATALAMSTIQPVVPASEYEQAVAEALNEVEIGGAEASVAGPPLDAARVAAGMSVDEAKIAFNTFVSRVVSVQIDKIAVTLGIDGSPRTTPPSEENAVEGQRHLNGLALTMKSANDLAQECNLVTGLAYVGARAKDEAARIDLYRAYAIFCLSDETRVKDDTALQGLVDMQMLLSLSDERAEEVNKEIAKGMFQVAVSSAMADGSMTAESKDALEQLKDSFGSFLDGGSADNIISEVSVMRAMYSLQQLLAEEQGVSEEDVAELRKMCADLGVDVDEMMQNAVQMGDSLGPEAQQFVGGLRALLQDGDSSQMAEGIDSLLANAGIDASKEELDAALGELGGLEGLEGLGGVGGLSGNPGGASGKPGPAASGSGGAGSDPSEPGVESG